LAGPEWRCWIRWPDARVTRLPYRAPAPFAVLDGAAGVLVVGDAINDSEGRGFILLGTSEDLPQTQASVGTLAGLSFDTLLPGHGGPIVGGAWKELMEYLAGA
jgi:glyoxylase-like metal-dependent hydrolase (beta-lactamase superfamily II)